ncbi:MAG: hypothetical protein MI802_28455 [Desulfobacterales bacterium]|nr:hypothetical protein [Desulfobacterales bacterium]
MTNGKKFEKRDEQFSRMCEEGTKIFRRKNRQYADAIATTGVLGASVEILGVASRLKPLVLHSPSHGRNEKAAILNVANDLHNFANILAMMVEDDNWEGI